MTKTELTKKKFSQIGPAVPEEIEDKETNTQTSCCYIREITYFSFYFYRNSLFSSYTMFNPSVEVKILSQSSNDQNVNLRLSCWNHFKTPALVFSFIILISNQSVLLNGEVKNLILFMLFYLYHYTWKQWRWGKEICPAQMLCSLIQGN